MSDAPATGPETGFAELVAATNYSFLRGASHPAEMVAEDLKTARRHALLRAHGHDVPVSVEG